MLPINVYQYLSFICIVVMDDVVRVSRGLHAVLMKIIASDEQVYIRRTATNLRDHIIRMEKEWTNGRLVPCFSGSKAEGLRFESSDEDWMYIYRNFKVIPPDYCITLGDRNIKFLLLMENEMTKPGFTLLKLVNFIGATDIVSNGSSIVVRMLDGLYVSCKMWREINIDSKKHTHKIFLHGPCASGFLQGGQEFDWAHCLKCDVWPKNAQSSIKRLHQSSWPSLNTIRDIVSDGVLFVPIGAKQSIFEDVEWRMSFSLAEKRLIHSMNHTQFLCYGLLKLFLKEAIDTNEDVKGLLCSYFLKTALFWEITASPNQWNPSSLLSYFWKCFSRLLQWVKSSYCPNFFIPENNMFEGKIEGHNRNKLLQSLSTLHHEGYRCLLRCSSLVSYPGMLDLMHGHLRIETVVVCTCGVCVALSIFNEQLSSYPLLPLCFALSKNIVCLVLEQLMRTANNNLQKFMTRRWLHRALTDVCMSKSSQNYSHKECNKIHYKNFVQGLRVLKRCRNDSLCHYVYQAMNCYNVGKYTQTLRIVEIAKDIIFTQNTMLVYRASTIHWRDAGGADLPIETVMRKSFYEHILHENIPELYIEAYSDMCRRIKTVKFPSVMWTLFLQYLCYNKLGNQQKCEESLYEISFIILNDEYYIAKFHRSLSWRILGICQQMSGYYRAAFRSYFLSLRIDIGEHHKRPPTYIRIGILLTNFF